jgi:hypothetical protein
MKNKNNCLPKIADAYNAPRTNEIALNDSSDDAEEDVIEIESDSDSGSTTQRYNNNKEPSSNRHHRAYEQNNNQDSDQGSTSSDVVIVSVDYQNQLHEDIERLSRIHTKGKFLHNFKISQSYSKYP